jgi:Cu/Zn superoxide dismutase
MIRITRVVLAAAVLALPACQAQDDTADDADAPAQAATEAPAPATPTLLMTIPIEAESGSKVGGQIQILSSDTDPAGFKVAASFTGVPEGEHAWHIHQGACGQKDTPVVVPFTEDKDKPAISEPIVATADGNVIKEVAVPGTLLSVQQLRDGDYSLHLHQKGGTDHGPTIGCATL